MARPQNSMARIALVGTALAVLTLAGHTAGSGAISPLGATTVVVLSGALAATTTRNRLGWRRVLGVLLAGQLLLHVVLTFTSHHGPGSHTSTGMVLAHGVAAGAATVAIVRADDLMARWRAFLSAVIGGWHVQVSAVDDSSLTNQVPLPAANDFKHAWLRHQVCRRGPPFRPVLTA